MSREMKKMLNGLWITNLILKSNLDQYSESYSSRSFFAVRMLWGKNARFSAFFTWNFWEGHIRIVSGWVLFIHWSLSYAFPSRHMQLEVHVKYYINWKKWNHDIFKDDNLEFQTHLLARRMKLERGSKHSPLPQTPTWPMPVQLSLYLNGKMV